MSAALHANAVAVLSQWAARRTRVPAATSVPNVALNLGVLA